MSDEVKRVQVVETTGGVNKYGDYMLKCLSATNERFQAFASNIDARNTIGYFEDAGYGELAALELNQKRTWKDHPIDVYLTKNGDFWNVISVNDRPSGAEADPIYTPDLKWHKNRAACHAYLVLEDGPVLVDTETTGVDVQAEIISVYVEASWVYPAYKTLVKPRNLAAVAATTHVHGITVEMLADQPTFEEVHQKLRELLDWQPWTAYNAPFDVGMIEQECMAKGLSPILPSAVHDVMMIYSKFAGLWDADKQRWNQIKLSEAVEACGLTALEAHDAGNDVEMMAALLKHMATFAPTGE